MSGRPTKYCQEMVDGVYEYLKIFNKDGYENYCSIPNKAGLALHIGISKKTVTEWCKEQGKEQFSRAVLLLESTQENILLGSSLEGDFNSSISKMLLSNHGHYERKQVETLGDNTLNIKISHE